jgi:hypothetical protein
VQPAQQAVALRLQLRPVPPRVDERRAVRQHCEGAGLGPRELPRIAAEVAPRRRLEPDDVAAERSMPRVKGEDLLLAVLQLQSQRERDLDQFSR